MIPDLSSWTEKWKQFSEEKKYVIAHLSIITLLVGIQYILGFLLNLFLGRIMGAYQFGIYSTAFHWFLFLGMNLGMATRSLIVRHGSLYLAEGKFSHWQKLIRTIWFRALGFHILFLGLAGSLIFFLQEALPDPALASAILVMLPGILLHTLTQIHSSALLAYRKTAVSFFLGRTAVHFFLVLGVTSVWLGNPAFLESGEKTVRIVSAVVGGVFFLGLGIYVWIFRKTGFPYPWSSSREAFPGSVEGLAWDRFFFFYTLQLAAGLFFNITSLLSGLLYDPGVVGTFNMAFRLLGPVQISALLIGTVISPLTPVLYRRGEHQRLEHMLNRLIQLGTMGSMILGLVFVVLAPGLARWLGDPQYMEEHFDWTVWILTAAGVYVIASGPTGALLNLLHLERYHIASLLAGTFSIGVLVIYAGRGWGAPGIAAGYFAGVLVYKTLNLYFLARKAGLRVGWWKWLRMPAAGPSIHPKDTEKA